MAGFSDTLGILSSGLQAQATRLRHISENVANADTPGYRRKMVDFTLDQRPDTPTGAVRTGVVQLDGSPLEEVFDPSHPLANADGYYDGSNVSLVVELGDAREAQRSYEANLKLFEQTRRMSSALSDILKR